VVSHKRGRCARLAGERARNIVVWEDDRGGEEDPTIQGLLQSPEDRGGELPSPFYGTRVRARATGLYPEEKRLLRGAAGEDRAPRRGEAPEKANQHESLRKT